MRVGSAKGIVAARVILPLAVTTLSFSGCAGQEESASTVAHDASSKANSEQPYAGFEERPIKALSEEKVNNLLEGKGAGYALAGELNHYPGPRHVLELSDELDLTAEQEQTVQEIYSAMEDEAKTLGGELVNLEERLDQAFRDEEIDEEELAQTTGEIATVEGRLRNAHLNAHLKMKDALDAQQVAMYDRLRGYAEGDGETGEEHSLHQ
ncbi:MAG: periplasmic heavy metal sensor [Actinobacteria bacterium]|nr:periplasmic heavy metal sensor [Actinomycetota bacterium]